MSIDLTETSAAMDCAELRRALDAYLDGELAEREQVEAGAHLAACEACRSIADHERVVRSATRRRLRAAMGPGSAGGTAPHELCRRIHLALVRERKPLWRHALAPLPIATLAACTLGVIVVLLTHGGADPLVEEAVSKHSRDLPLEVTAASMGPESIAGWFAGKLDFNAAPPRFRDGAVRLVGARLSNIRDRPAAYVRYDLPRGHLGLFILDDPDRLFADARRIFHVGSPAVRIVNARGFNVAVWRRNAIVYSLVSDLDEADLARLVRAAQGAPER